MHKTAHIGTYRWWWLGLIACFAGCFVGCPGEKPTDGTIACSKGAYCLFVGNKEARACTVIIKVAALKFEQTGFAQKVIGELHRQGEQIAFSFVVRKNEPLNSDDATAVMTLSQDAQNNSDNLQLEKAICYDAKGAEIQNPKVTMKRQ